MPLRILMVDDDRELCGEVADILKDEGYAVDIACDGLEGESRLKQNHYDVLLLDVKMPGLSGVELLERIKGELALKPKIFLISGRPFLDKLLGDNSLSDLISATFPKPFDIVALVAKIKEST